MECRLCHSSKTELFLDLGFVPIVNKYLTNEDLTHSEALYPLTVYFCSDCNLVQLGYLVPPTELFNEKYPYDSRMTKSRKESYSNLVNFICDKFNFKQNSLVVDIGSNTGLLLELFKMRGLKVIGIDASANVAKIANSMGVETIVGFFGKELVEKIVSGMGKATIITATNVLAHIQDYDSFANTLKKLITEDGIFIFQVPHLLKLVNNLEFDTIYHEHVCYFGLKPLKRFFEKFDLEIFDIKEDEIDGGSIQCFVGKKDKYKTTENINKILKEEEASEIYSKKRLQKFAEDVRNHKRNLLNLLVSLKNQNKRIVGIGAAAKGVVLMNYCKIDSGFLDFVTEKDPLKIGKFVPGMHMPVVPDEILLKEQPDYALVLAWNFAQEIMENLCEYKNKGGKFIIPIPILRVI